MSSEVMTHENWARLHVARRVSDIAKSMIKLSRLGRSIFPTPSHPLRGGEELAARLKVSEASCVRTRTAKAYPRNLGCARPMNPRATLGLPAVSSSPRQAGIGLGPCPGSGRHGGRPSPGVVGRANLVVGTDPRPIRR